MLSTRLPSLKIAHLIKRIGITLLCTIKFNNMFFIGTKMSIKLLLKIMLTTVFAAVFTQTVQAQQYKVEFEPQRAELEQQITGDEFNDYLVSAKAGDILNVTLTPSNLSNYFNILPLDSNEAVFIGSIEGHEAKYQLSTDGDYIVRVYLMRNAARRGETSDYKLTIIKHAGVAVPVKTMHPSWDSDGDGINDCENDGSCDHTVDYTKPKTVN